MVTPIVRILMGDEVESLFAAVFIVQHELVAGAASELPSGSVEEVEELGRASHGYVGDLRWELRGIGPVQRDCSDFDMERHDSVRALEVSSLSDG